PEYREFIPAGAFDGRSPCPALNTLANHGYISRNGHDIHFFELIDALQRVYNVTWVLAFTLTLVGFLISGKLTFVRDGWFLPSIRWTVSLSTLSMRGPYKIAHNAAFVHPNSVPSHAPDKNLLQRFLTFASSRRSKSYHRELHGLSLADFALYHKKMEDELHSPLNEFHRQVALGECGLAWAVMRRRSSTGPKGSPIDEREEMVTADVLNQWFGSEKLPENWFNEGGLRPVHPIGLLEAKRRAGHVAQMI
ncbi:hypothetical protein AGABI2DRAFT_52638, partial [Agaricus bisporus var. bisporus H97]|uniref:hypothetical protein n=1 Tax=Agaricus bisporus var. bisporus (strain H97 / ATCC MYA-4626 / FGSC 10389) TaxID=936046 RepID=UPI00029F4F10